MKPLAPELYKVQFTVSRETHEKLREARDLLRHVIPNGDVGAIFERAVTVLLRDLRKSRHALVDRPRASSSPRGRSRHIPAAIKREVLERDQGQCAFVGAMGRCTERGFLEYHHAIPFADGGATNTTNLELRCRAHNAFEVDLWAGARAEDLVRDPKADFSRSGTVRDVVDGTRWRDDSRAGMALRTRTALVLVGPDRAAARDCVVAATGRDSVAPDVNDRGLPGPCGSNFLRYAASSGRSTRVRLTALVVTNRPGRGIAIAAAYGGSSPPPPAR